MEPRFEVELKIRKPVGEVFEAVVDPVKLSAYFTTTATGPLAEGMTVMWSFPEVPKAFPVKVRSVVREERIALEWEATEGGYNTRVEMLFKALEGGQATIVQIRESGWRPTPKGVESSYGNCGGWMHMMCCLKAYLEYGINLRAGGAH